MFMLDYMAKARCLTFILRPPLVLRKVKVYYNTVCQEINNMLYYDICKVKILFLAHLTLGSIKDHEEI